jgi:hypothetical protein
VSNVIDFLQRLAQDADLRHAPRIALELALTEADIDPALREALLGTDQRKLESLLGADTNVCAMISPGQKEESEEEDEDDVEDDEDEDEDDDEDEDEDDFDEDEDEDEDDDEDEDEDDEEEENSLTPRRSTVRRVA